MWIQSIILRCSPPAHSGSLELMLDNCLCLCVYSTCPSCNCPIFSNIFPIKLLYFSFKNSYIPIFWTVPYTWRHSPAIVGLETRDVRVFDLVFVIWHYSAIFFYSALFGIHGIRSIYWLTNYWKLCEFEISRKNIYFLNRQVLVAASSRYKIKYFSN